jgi:predicted lipoprotein with Yx(FWY)xxD motif
MPKQTLTRIYAVIAGALVVAATITAVALAQGSQTPTVAAASNSKLQESVVVDTQGRTLYALSPETSRHLLCKSAACLHVWPPLTVSSRAIKLKAGAGVHGTLGLLHRSTGVWQVTLRGMPLYRFSGDHGKDESNGEGLQSFGGTWHAASAATGAGSKPTTQAAPMAPATSSEPYAASSPSGSSTSTGAAPSPAPMPSTQSTPTTPTTSTPTYTYPAY